MTILVLDLDLTVFVTDVDKPILDTKSQVLSSLDGKIIAIKNEEIRTFSVQIINPPEISSLINHACEQHNGIIILTGGFWDEKSTKSFLCNFLKLQPKSKKMIEDCDFLTPGNTIEHFENKTEEDIYLLNKRERLDAYLLKKPALQNETFVLLDDNSSQVKAFESHKKVIAVYAGTSCNDYDPNCKDPLYFYDVAKKSMDDPTFRHEVSQINQAKIAHADLFFDKFNKAILKRKRGIESSQTLFQNHDKDRKIQPEIETETLAEICP